MGALQLLEILRKSLFKAVTIRNHLRVRGEVALRLDPKGGLPSSKFHWMKYCDLEILGKGQTFKESSESKT